jgi:hypothetical protein
VAFAGILLPGGATATWMLPDTVPEEARKSLLHPDVMRAPAVFLASDEAKALQGRTSWPRTSSAGSLTSAPGPASPRADDGGPSWPLRYRARCPSAKIAP